MKAVVDRFEGELAVLEVHGQERRIPRLDLSPQAREGDVVDLPSGIVNTAASRRRRERIGALREDVARKKGRPPGDFDL